MRYLFLKFTIVLIELAGALALLAGVALIAVALNAWEPGGVGSTGQAKLLLPDGRTLALAELPLLRFLSLAPGVGGCLLGILMLGVGQLGEVVLQMETMLRKPPK
jgi:hypothetical protein